MHYNILYLTIQVNKNVAASGNDPGAAFLLQSFL